ncbi:MAG TPA: Flp pilus assembly protein CpaB [Mycobacteriales bacterium]|nr:Flp pilus assembly protein CpaB [Mycobacteriales bacterium]
MNRRIGLLAVALVVALFGTAAVFTYVSRMEARTLAGAEPVSVLVAAAQIPSGTSGDSVAASKLVEVVSMPRKAVPEGALTTLDGIGSQTLASDVYAGEILLRAKFADNRARTGALLIPKGRLAVAVQLGDPQRVAGFVLPGSEVAVFNSAEDGTRLLLPRVSIIAVGDATLKPVTTEGKQAEEPVPTAIMTLALTQAEAEKVVHATNTGSLYFGLLSADSQTGPSAGVNTANLYS